MSYPIHVNSHVNSIQAYNIQPDMINQMSTDSAEQLSLPTARSESLRKARLRPSLQDRGEKRGYMTRLPIPAVESIGLSQGAEPEVLWNRDGVIVLDYRENE